VDEWALLTKNRWVCFYSKPFPGRALACIGSLAPRRGGEGGRRPGEGAIRMTHAQAIAE